MTMTLMFDNDPTWADLFWFVEKAREATVSPSDNLAFEYDPHRGPQGLFFFQHPETGEGN